MIYTDGIHLVADTLAELHAFARTIGLKRHFFHGTRKGHPHYDLTNSGIKKKAILKGARFVGIRDVLKISLNTVVLSTSHHNYTANEVKAHKNHEKRIGLQWLRS